MIAAWSPRNSWNPKTLLRTSAADLSPVRRPGQQTALRQLLPHLWPAGDLELRVRVLLAIGFLVAAKLANVYLPIMFKHMIDALTPKAGTVLVLPVGMLLAYGAARILAPAF